MAFWIQRVISSGSAQGRNVATSTQPTRTLADLAADDRVSRDALDELTLTHRSGVRVIAGCDQPEHAAAFLVAALTNPAASPVLAVGSTVIDATPTPVKEWAVRHFGTADKTILIGSVLAVTLAVAAWAGVVLADVALRRAQVVHERLPDATTRRRDRALRLGAPAARQRGRHTRSSVPSSRP